MERGKFFAQNGKAVFPAVQRVCNKTRKLVFLQRHMRCHTLTGVGASVDWESGASGVMSAFGAVDDEGLRC